MALTAAAFRCTTGRPSPSVASWPPPPARFDTWPVARPCSAHRNCFNTLIPSTLNPSIRSMSRPGHVVRACGQEGGGLEVGTESSLLGPVWSHFAIIEPGHAWHVRFAVTDTRLEAIGHRGRARGGRAWAQPGPGTLPAEGSGFRVSGFGFGGPGTLPAVD